MIFSGATSLVLFHLAFENFHSIKNNNLVALQTYLGKIVDSDPTHGHRKACEKVAERDAAGGTIHHVAYLLEQYTIGRWLVENYPMEGNIGTLFNILLDLNNEESIVCTGLLAYSETAKFEGLDATISFGGDNRHISSSMMPYKGWSALIVLYILRQ